MVKKLISPLSIVALCAILIFTGCKKNNPTVVGNWQFSSYSSNFVSYNKTYPDSVFENMVYNTQTQTIDIYIRRTNVLPLYDTAVHSLTYSNWNIMSNGNYTINENADTITTTNTGTWEYLSNTNANNAISFNNGGSFLLQYAAGYGVANTLKIQSVTSNQLVLSYAYSSVDSAGNFAVKNSSITFVK
jgi:hypothetical protein